MLESKKNTDKKPIRIIELVGPAGSGKTTLSSILGVSNQITIINTLPYYRSAKNLPFFIKNSILCLPIFYRFRNQNKTRWFTGEQLIFMVTLFGWHNVLKKKIKEIKTSIILDEGPIYHLAYLKVYGPELIREKVSQKWWEDMYHKWAETIDCIVWLDSSNNILVNRIRSREKYHGVKDKSDSSAYKYLEDLRSAYSQIIHSLSTMNRSIKILNLNTEIFSVENISNQIKNELNIQT